MIFRFIGYLFGIGAVLFLAIAAVAAWYISGLTADLPNYDVLAKYEPPVMTRVHAADGQLVAEYANERRLYLPIQAIPDRVKAAFISAEDKNFYEHSGLDYYGIVRAVLHQPAQQGRRQPAARWSAPRPSPSRWPRTSSSSSDQTIDRKIKEAMLSLRIEQAYSKDKILELYLNEIFFGLGAYGVASAALTYFDKSVHELTLAETAYLAALPKGPNNYNPFRYPDRAVERRNWVIDRMVENGYATTDEGEAAKKEPLGVNDARHRARDVRRRLFRRGSPPRADRHVRRADALRGRPVGAHLAQPAAPGDGPPGADRRSGQLRPGPRLARSGRPYRRSRRPTGGRRSPTCTALADVVEWRLAVVLSVDAKGAKIGLQPGREPGTGKVAARPRDRDHPLRPDEMGQVADRPEGGQGDQGRRRRALGRRRGLCREGRRRPRRIPPAPGAGGRGRHRRDGPAHRPRARHGRRLLLRRKPVQPRHPGRAPARLLLQAVRLFRRARQRLHAVLGDHGRADRRSIWAAARACGSRRTTRATSSGRRRCAPASSSRATS